MIYTREEYILCAANYWDDGERHVHQPKNVESGFVVTGRRHHNIYAVVSILSGKRAPLWEQDPVEGFLTSKDRFVDREEAAQLAYDAGQTIKRVERLFSEDIYSE